MKKTLSLFLCLTMLVLSVASCFPAFAVEMQDDYSNLQEGGTVTVTFVGEGLSSVYDPIEVTAGEPLDLTAYYSVTPTNAALRFNGWSTTGEVEDIVSSITPTEDMSVYAIVNSDINLLIHGTAGWTVDKATASITEDGIKFSHVKNQNNSVQYTYTFDETARPALTDNRQVIYYYVDAYTRYNNNRHSRSYEESLSEELASSSGPFGFTSTNATASVPSSVEQVTGSNGVNYAKFTVNVASNNSWKQGGNLISMKVAPYDKGYYDATLAYIRFVPYYIYEEDIEIAVTAIPETGKALPSLSSTDANIAKIESAEWITSPDSYGVCADDTPYSAKFVLSPKVDGYQFREDVTATINGQDPDSFVLDASTGKITVTYTFPNTEKYKDLTFNLDNLTNIYVSNAQDLEQQLAINVVDPTDETADTSVTWSITEGNEHAYITESGMLTISSNGTVKIMAQSNYRHDRFAEKEIEVAVDESLMATIIFVGDINESIDSVTAAKGTTLDLANFLDCTSAIEGMRFNGWTLTGDFNDVETGIIDVTGDMTLTAVVNYDFNFAIPANQTGWKYAEGTISYEDGYLVVKDSPTTKHIDNNLISPAIELPAAVVATIQLYIDPNVVKYTVDANTGERTGTDSVVGVEDYIEGIYFAKGTEPFTGQTRVEPASPRTLTEDGLLVVEHNVYTNQHWEGAIGQFRFDFIAGENDYRVRYINIVEKSEFDVKEIKIQGVTEPKTGVNVSTTAKEVNGIGVISEVKWTPEDTLITYELNGKEYQSFNENQEYTVEITVTPISGTSRKFADDSFATINGKNADIVLNHDGTATITYTYSATDAFKVFGMEISGPSEITKKSRVSQYNVEFTGDIPQNTDVMWSVSDTDKAEIDPATGKLVPLGNGTVNVIATSLYNPEIFKEFPVEISNQGEEVTITYDSATEDVVEGMPEQTVGTGIVVLSTDIPTRDGYVFVGWSKDDESTETVTRYAPGKDATVYAVWHKVSHKWDFNGTTEGFSKYNLDALTPNAEYMSATTTGNGDSLIQKTGLNIDASKQNKIIVKYATSETKNELAQMFYYQQGNASPFSKTVQSGVTTTGLDNWMEVVVDLKDVANWTGTIETIRFDLTSLSPGITWRVDYIYILDSSRTVTFDANADGDEVSNMPESMEVLAGDSINIDAVPVREGYDFVGWAKSADPEEDDKIKSSWTILENVTFYAVWIKRETPDISDPTTVNIGDVDDEAILVLTQNNIPVYLSYIDGNGDHEITVVSNGIGYAVFDLTQATAPITNAVVTTDEAAIDSASVTSLNRAKNIAETYVDNGSDVTAQEGLDNGGNKTPVKYDTTTTTITTEGKIKPSEINPAVDTDPSTGISEEEFLMSRAENIKALLALDVPVDVNFDRDLEKKFFTTLRRFIYEGTYDSISTYVNLGLSSSGKAPALYTSEFSLDTETHKYVVMRARNQGYSSNKITMNYKQVNGYFDNANEITVENENNGEFSYFVWDMTKVKGWKGKIGGLYFAFGTEKDAVTEIDWVYFTEELPEDLSTIEGAMEYFPIVNREEMPFEDVLETDWFYSEVAQAYKLDFVKGTSETTYDPLGNVTLAEVVTLAVRLSSMYNGKEIPEVATEGDWFAPFVEAAVEAGIVEEGQYNDYNEPALRRDVIKMMSKIFPNEYLPAINMFIEVPGMRMSDKIYNDTLAFYNAGITVGGSENYFNADTYIARCEIAAIVNRLADPESRVRVITQAEIESKRIWYYPEELVGASLNHCTESKITGIKDGYLTATSTGVDPIVFFDGIIPPFDGYTKNKITVALRWDKNALANIKSNELFFITASDSAWTGAKKFTGTPGVEDADGFVAFTFDVTTLKTFDDTVTGIRFDPFAKAGVEFQIAYVMIE